MLSTDSIRVCPTLESDLTSEKKEEAYCCSYNILHEQIEVSLGKNCSLVQCAHHLTELIDKESNNMDRLQFSEKLDATY